MTHRVLALHGPLLSEWTWPARGRVLSAHRRAVNLLFAGGALLSLVAPEHGNGPGTMVVAGEWPLPLREGAPVRLTGGALHGSGLTLALQGAVLWVPPAPPGARAGAGRRLPVGQLARAGHPAGLLPAALAALRAGGRAQQAAPGPGAAPGPAPAPALSPAPNPPPAPAPGPAAQALTALAAEGIAALGARRWPDGVRGLAGLGPGLTPAGDDLLCGYLTALHRARHPAAAELGAQVTALPARTTTPLSHHLLRWAARGVAGEHHLAWVDSLLTGSPLPMRTVINHGATSGTDWAAGALLALHHHLIKELNHDGQAV